MKTIVEINGINYGSTGKITGGIAGTARKNGFNVYSFFKNSRETKAHLSENQFLIGIWAERVLSERLSFYTGLNGYFNIIGTRLFINRLKKIKPDLVQIHSLCDSFVNIRMLFNYLSRSNIPVVWTLHDNWAFTGRCAQPRCEKWKSGCGNCPHLDYYPGSAFIDRTRHVFNVRKRIYSRLSNLTIVTPSRWLADLVKESLFSDRYPVKVISNGINLDLFKPTNSSFREKNNLQDKHIVLGVAYYWDEFKGLFDFISLSRSLPDNYKIVMVGTNDETDRLLPESILSIHRTYDQKELIDIYSSSDVFVIPTYDDNYPTVIMESIACGTPVITYDVGGCKEIGDDTCRSVLNKGDLEGLEKEIISICETGKYSKNACLEYAKNFSEEIKYESYIDLYKEILSIDEL